MSVYKCAGKRDGSGIRICAMPDGSFELRYGGSSRRYLNPESIARFLSTFEDQHLQKVTYVGVNPTDISSLEAMRVKTLRQKNHAQTLEDRTAMS